MKSTVNIQGYEFKVEKQVSGYTAVKYNMNLGHWTKTKKEFLILQDDLNREALAKGIDVKKEVKKAQVRTHFKLINKVFDKIIGFPIPCDPMLKALTGRYLLDVILLDKLIKTPDGVSTKEHIKTTYGEFALRVVEFCLRYM